MIAIQTSAFLTSNCETVGRSNIRIIPADAHYLRDARSAMLNVIEENVSADLLAIGSQRSSGSHLEGSSRPPEDEVGPESIYKLRDQEHNNECSRVVDIWSSARTSMRRSRQVQLRPCTCMTSRLSVKLCLFCTFGTELHTTRALQDGHASREYSLGSDVTACLRMSTLLATVCMFESNVNSNRILPRRRIWSQLEHFNLLPMQNKITMDAIQIYNAQKT